MDMKRITRAAGVLLAMACLGACTYTVRESNIVTPRSAPATDVTALRALFPDYDIEPFTVTAPDGARLKALRFVRGDARATVLYFGGNGYTVARFAPRTLASYRELPLNVVLVDHRGYGGSSGTPSVQMLMSDAGVVYSAVRADPALTGLPLLLHGHSLGSFMSGHVAAERKVDGVILESSVTTTEDWTAHLRSQQSWWLRMLVWRVEPDKALARMGNQAAVARFDEPVLFVVGEDDDITPPRFSRSLFETAPLPQGRKHLLVVPGRQHQDASASPEFQIAVSGLLEQVLAADTE